MLVLVSTSVLRVCKTQSTTVGSHTYNQEQNVFQLQLALSTISQTCCTSITSCSTEAALKSVSLMVYINWVQGLLLRCIAALPAPQTVPRGF